ncbi:MAG: LemA family protein [Candidatus Peribacteraceae bacterium]|nr:LemA family protein [Candidatus Peribacteraceae bacterium]
MVRGCLIIGSVFVALVVLIPLGIGLAWWSTYNDLNAKNQGQLKLWGNVESAMQRRNDLIPNLVETLKGSGKFEKSTLTDVIEARSKISQINIGQAATDPALMAKLKAAESELSGALSRLLVVVERYPELKTTDAYRDFMAEYAGTENRINVARQRYNDGVEPYNTLVGVGFAHFVANTHGFKLAEYFKADEAAKTAPKVKFD